MQEGDRQALFGPASPTAAGGSGAAASTQYDGPHQGAFGGGGGGGGGGGWHRRSGAQDPGNAGADGVDSQFQLHPHQQQPLTWAQVRGNIDVAERQRGLRSAYESVEVGREALERLDDHKERLERSEMVLDSTRYTIERSARVLRGMTFWGKIRNAFSHDPEIPQQVNQSAAGSAGASAASAAAAAAATLGAGAEHHRLDENATVGASASAGDRSNYSDSHANSIDNNAAVEGFICPDCRKRFFAADALVGHFESAHTDAGHASHSNRSGGEDVARGACISTGVNGGGGGRGGSSFAPGSPSLKDQLFGDRGGGGNTRATFDTGSLGRGRNGRGGGRGDVIAEQKAVMASQDAYLESVGRAVQELGLLGRNIGASLDGQKDTLDRVAEKTTDVNDRTAFVTRKAARRAQSSRPKKPVFIMSVALQEVSTGLYLAVKGEEVALQGRELRNVCRFEAWERQHGIIGLKSSVTRRWLGQTLLGYLRVSGASFGRNYEWQADLGRKETTMVCCSANWGAGGYLSFRSGKKLQTRGGEGGINAPGAAAAAEVAADCAELALVDATLVNKPRAAVFRVVNCEGYTPQPFVGGRLMQNPGPPPPPGVQPLPRNAGREGWG